MENPVNFQNAIVFGGPRTCIQFDVIFWIIWAREDVAVLPSQDWILCNRVRLEREGGF